MSNNEKRHGKSGTGRDQSPEKQPPSPAPAGPSHGSKVKVAVASTRVGTKPGETRATFIVDEQQLEAVKALAHWERITIKDVLAEALAHYLASKKVALTKAMKSYRGKVGSLNTVIGSALATVRSELGDRSKMAGTPASEALTKAVRSLKKLNGVE